MSYERTVFENDTLVDAAEVLNKFDAAIADLYGKVNGELVWENADTTATFAAQTVSIESDKRVEYYEIIYRARTTTAKDLYVTSGKIPIGLVCNLFNYDASSYYRTVTPSQADNGTVSLTFANALSGSTTSNGSLIPYQIKFYYE